MYIFWYNLLYFAHFGTLSRVKSGNPGLNILLNLDGTSPTVTGDRTKVLKMSPSKHVQFRVTRLGEPSPIGRLFNWDTLKKYMGTSYKYVTRILGILSSTVQDTYMSVNFYKKGWAGEPLWLGGKGME
jgi:hypothetical protein